MATVIYNEFKRADAAGDITWDSDDLRVLLCMTNSTAGTQNDTVVTVANITTLDEMDGANYVRKSLASLVVNKNDAQDRAECDAADVTWTTLGNGARDIQGVLIYKHIDGNPANDLVVAYLQFGSVQSPDDADFTIQWDATGILHLT